MDRIKPLTTGEAAKWCGVSFRTVLRWIERGDLIAYKLPGRGDRRILTEEFIKFLTRNEIPVPEGLSSGALRVLIAEDDPYDAKILERMLRTADFEVKTATDGFSAGALAISFLPDVMIVDLNMLGMGGVDLIRLARAMPQLADVRFLVVSGMHQEALDQAVEEGADAALGKPVGMELLIKTVRGLTAVVRR